MAISLISQAANNTANSDTANLTVTLGTHATNDVMILGVQTADGLATSPLDVTVSGWTLLVSEHATAGTDVNKAILYRVATSASETDPVIVPDVSARIAGEVLVFRGVDTTNIFDVTSTTNDNIVNDVQGAAPAITPTTNNGALVIFEAIAPAASTSRVTVIGAPATPSGMTASNGAIADINLAQCGFAYKEDYGSATTFTPTDWTHTVVDNNAESGNVTMALRPAGATTSDINYTGTGHGILRGLARGVG